MTFAQWTPDQISAFAALVTTGIALVAALFAWRQIISSTRAQREATAKAAYATYLEMAYERPDFAAPDYDGAISSRIDFTRRTFDGSLLDFERYEWFVHRLLSACDEVLAVAKLSDWHETVRGVVAFHGAYFCSSCWPHERNRKVYDPQLMAI